MKINGAITYVANIYSAMMIEQIKNGLMSPDEGIQQDSIYLIGCIFERFRGHGSDDIPEEINGIDINVNIVEDLKGSLVNYLASNPSEINRASAINALRKTLDENMKGFFMTALKNEINGSPVVLYQIMIALNDLGEDCFNGKQSLSEFDIEENIDSAKKYLDRVERTSDLT